MSTLSSGPGAYLLYLEKGDKLPHYVGRADIDIHSELKGKMTSCPICNKDIIGYEYFKVEQMKDAYYKECLLYHMHQEHICNESHPIPPQEQSFVCPLC